ncbi:hypothetical protein KGP95_11085 [Burkholderia multivorans]|uniref:cupin domain-containing protein n=1 Tax=Burkholderia multivorans TaxID=87883 RepID=UPI00209C95B8|nr:cupin domain-containing protein [Burkholderia multivorans]MCO8610281.1 hypothetical protein [Burkholderia multivorans]MCO8637880.1 hypothetical protein [Burkholderia multivorans]MCO8648327.1 hypothetical protein [Burkholderia multivorans]
MNKNFFRETDFESFVSHALHIRPYRLGTVAHHGLPNWNNLNALLGSGLLDYPRIRIISTNEKYSDGYSGFIRYSSNPRGGRLATIMPDVLERALDDGCTIIIDGCQDYFPSVLTLTNEIECSLNCQAWANLYISGQSGTSFGCHFDDHDIISVQLFGEKRWHIYNPTYLSPNRGDKSFYLDPPTGAPDVIEHLPTGSSLYVPSGYWHNVQTISPYSLHVTIGLDFLRNMDIARAMINRLGLDERFRGVANFLPYSPKSYVLREDLVNAIREIDFDACIETAIKIHKQRRPAFNFPHHKEKK